MTGPQLATVATGAWLVLTVTLFIELANWSAGGSWTIVPGIVRGVHGWATRGQEPDLARFALERGVPPPAPATDTAAGVDIAASADPEPRPMGPGPLAQTQLDPGAEVVELDRSEVVLAGLKTRGR